MMISKAELKNPNVNGGNYVNLYANSINETQAIFSSVQDQPNNPSDTWNDRLSKGVNTGFQNPTITINGVHTLNSTHVTGTLASIDFEYIKDFVANADQVCTLKCDYYKTTSNPTGEISVMLKNRTGKNGNENTVHYSFTFIEVKE